MAAEARLWQLISPALPVGGYSYSQGLEYAVQAGWVGDAASAEAWVGGVAETALTAIDVPLMLRIHAAASAGDGMVVRQLSARLAAMRESAELRREDADMAHALRRLLGVLAPRFDGAGIDAYAALFAAVAAHWSIPAKRTASGYVWAWLENQVQAATRLVPLGQSEAQAALFALGARIGPWVECAALCGDDEIGGSAPGSIIASAAHETQYTRLFRS